MLTEEEQGEEGDGEEGGGGEGDGLERFVSSILFWNGFVDSCEGLGYDDGRRGETVGHSAAIRGGVEESAQGGPDGSVRRGVD